MSTTAPLALIGLGNPGAKYHNTRHNIGFMALDCLEAHVENAQHGSGKKHSSLTYSGLLNTAALPPHLQQEVSEQQRKVLLCKPQTFMNLSGEAVLKLKSFYRLTPSNMLIISDDLDFPFGHVRFKKSGSGGSHNGLKSVAAHIGKNFYRLRLGIGSPMQNLMPTDKFVLSNFSENEMQLLEHYLANIAKAIACFCFFGIEKAMNQFNAKTLLPNDKEQNEKNKTTK